MSMPPQPEAREEPMPPSGRAPVPLRWRLHVGLFVATLFSVFLTGAMRSAPEVADGTLELPLLLHYLRHLHTGWTFAVPLMAILVTHEFGHYFAARIHRVPASLPFFIPMPPILPVPGFLVGVGRALVFAQLSIFGTMGAVISMPAPIRSRSTLLDIGAAGPIAGFVVAVVVLVIGLGQSEVRPITGSGLQEGQFLLYWLLKRAVLGEIPPGHDVFLTETAFAGWAGMFVTMLNLLPIGQLDGGHIGYALFGDKQERYARVLHAALLGVFAYNLVAFEDSSAGMVWLVWFFLLFLVRRHPPTDPGTLTPRRRWVAGASLVLFVLLFMPTPLRAYSLASAGLVESAQGVVSGALAEGSIP